MVVQRSCRSFASLRMTTCVGGVGTMGFQPSFALCWRYQV
jgi:hypothetical protein